MTDQDIIDAAAGYNVGDLALGYKPFHKRENILNSEALASNIFPNDIINRAEPRANFTFRWCSMDDSQYSNKYIADSKVEGYKVVTKSEWLLNQDAWSWFTPEKTKYRWSVSNMLINGYDEFLMYRNEARFRQEEAKRLAIHDDQIKQRYESTADQAARIGHDAGIGIEVDAKVGGKTVA